MKTPINYIISVKNTLKCAIENINQNCIQATVVVDENNKLCGIVTDGDIRRALLNEISLDDSVERVMTQDPISVYDSVPEIQILAIMRKNSIHHIPVINQSGEVINVHTVDDHLYFTEFTNHVVIMAGGKGERLRPLTNDCPKPMLKVDGKPILEHVLQNCISSGFSKFLISVNYLKEQIKDYFSSGKKWGVEISYIEEKSAMGTCGSLSLVSDLINQDFLVINGDIFTDLDFGKLLKFHQKHLALLNNLLLQPIILKHPLLIHNFSIHSIL